MTSRRAAITLAVIAVVLLGANLLFTAHYVNATQQAARRQGAVVEHKICTTLGRIAALQPPPGNPMTNPSRAYEQRLHETLSQLAPDLGCEH